MSRGDSLYRAEPLSYLTDSLCKVLPYREVFMSGNTVLYLNQKDVREAGLGMPAIIEAVEQALAELGNGKVEMPPKPGIHPVSNENFIHAMPAYIPALNSAGMKWVSGYPGNAQKGLPYINGLLILNDTETGLPLSIMDCVWITAMRTGAASALSARHLARPDSEKIGILACGVQGHTNLEAMNVLFPLKKVYCFDPCAPQADKLADYARNSLGLEAEIVSDPRDAVAGMDIIVTAGPILKTPHETIKADWMDPGAFASLVDFDCYWARAALAQADIWTTDYHAQYEYYRDVAGYFQNCPPLHGDLGELVTGKVEGRQNSEQRTFAANLGLAVEDMAVAPRLYELARERGVGVELEL